MQQYPRKGAKYVTPEEQKQDRNLYYDGKLHTEFELKLVRAERQERFDAKSKYLAGIQGVDGGCFDHRDIIPPY
jgi:hypothetical protein